MFKKFKKTALTLSLLIIPLYTHSISAQAETEMTFSSNMGFMSDYVYRGVHQSGSSGYGGFDVEYGNFYVGTWFADLQEGGWNTNTHRGFEYDVYAGFGLDITDTISASIGYTIYRYTDKGANAFDDDYDEFNIGLSFAMSDSLSVAIDYANGENTATDQSETDYDVGTITVDYLGAYVLFGAWGINEDDTGETDAEWMEVGYSRTVGDFDIAGSFILSEKELATASDTQEDGDFSRFVFSIGTSF